jgi:hypothetical protein
MEAVAQGVSKAAIPLPAESFLDKAAAVVDNWQVIIFYSEEIS